MELKDRVFDAADKLESQRIRPTLDKIREALGGGSFTSIGPFLRDWKAKKITSVDLPPTPEDLMNRMIGITNDFWSQAVQHAEDRLSSDRAYMQAEIDYLNENIQSVSAAADKAIAERDAASVRINELEELLKSTNTQFDSLQRQASKWEVQCQESKERISDLQANIGRIMELTAKNKELAKLCAAEPTTTQKISPVPLQQEDTSNAKRTGNLVLKKRPLKVR